MRKIRLNSQTETIVDDEDYDRVSHLKWFAMKTPNGSIYAIAKKPGTTGKGKRNLLLHSYIMDLHLGVNQKKYQINHIDGNPLNNQKDNLELCDYMWNNLPHNKMSYSIGSVSFNKKNHFWTASVRMLGQTHSFCSKIKEDAELQLAQFLQNQAPILIENYKIKMNNEINNYIKELKEKEHIIKEED